MVNNYFKIVHQNKIVSLHFFDDSDTAKTAATHVAALATAREIDRSYQAVRMPSQLCVWRRLSLIPSIREVGEVIEIVHTTTAGTIPLGTGAVS